MSEIPKTERTPNNQMSVATQSLAEGFHQIAHALIQPSAFNARKTIDESQLQELAESIKQKGILEPVLVRPLQGNGHYELIAGERRWRAAKLAGQPATLFLDRHANGDWGDVSEDDSTENHESLQRGCRILSAYILKTGTRIWIITEADRRSTCVLLPHEY